MDFGVLAHALDLQLTAPARAVRDFGRVRVELVDVHHGRGAEEPRGLRRAALQRIREGRRHALAVRGPPRERGSASVAHFEITPVSRTL